MPSDMPEVAHGEAEGQPAQAPHGAPEPGPPEGRGGGLAQHAQQVPRVDGGQDPGGDDPAEEAPDQPVDLPGPLLHPPVGDVEAARGEAAEPVEEDAEERVRRHSEASLRARTALDVEDLPQVPRDGAAVGVRRHQVPHVPPPPLGRRPSKRRPPSAPRSRSRRSRRARSSRDRDRSSSSARRGRGACPPALARSGCAGARTPRAGPRAPTS